MFGWFKKKQEPPPTTEKIAHQLPGEMFSWPKGWRITALDESIIAVPAAIIGDKEVIGAVIHCGEEVRLNFPTEPNSPQDARIMIWLLPGQSVWLSKSCQAVVVPLREGDKAARRFTVVEVTQ
jgi:hypothetical protein